VRIRSLVYCIIHLSQACGGAVVDLSLIQVHQQLRVLAEVPGERLGLRVEVLAAERLGLPPACGGQGGGSRVCVVDVVEGSGVVEGVGFGKGM
jgi:hypothetical protein